MLLNDKYIRTIAIVTVLAITGLVAYRLFLCSVTSPQPNIQVRVSPSDPNATQPQLQAENNRYVVNRVIDGDTLVLSNGDTVRLIGVDTPETNHPEIPVQRFGKEATEFTQRMVEGMKINLEFEGTREDGYGRKLAYVFVDGVLLNKEIIRRGYGYAYTRFPHSRTDEFIAAEREARAKQYGLWNYSLTDGRITNLVNRYEQLNPEGKRKLEEKWDDLLRNYPESQKIGEEQ